jgi:hypothetical protein
MTKFFEVFWGYMGFWENLGMEGAIFVFYCIFKTMFFEVLWGGTWDDPLFPHLGMFVARSRQIEKLDICKKKESFFLFSFAPACESKQKSLPLAQK